MEILKIYYDTEHIKENLDIDVHGSHGGNNLPSLR